jgi:flagella basal body P-ring formation protein FlgA
MAEQLLLVRKAMIRLLWCLTAVSGGAVLAEVPNVVDLNLPEEAVVYRSLVTIADVAQMSGGTPTLRALIGAIDVAELAEVSSSETIRSSQLKLRLGLAGFDSADFRLSGASRTLIIRRSEQIRDELIIRSVQGPLAAHWGVDPSLLQVRLARPLSSVIRESLETNEALDLKPFVPESCRPGRLPLNIGAYRDGQLVETFPVTLDVELTRRVMVARQDLRPGERITAEDVQVEKRSLTGRTAIQVADEAVGQLAARWIRAGDVLERTHVQLRRSSPREDARSHAVPRRTVVRLVARKPGLLVTVRAAELMDDARVGDTVRVRNLTSNKVVTGRLVDPGQVEVSF